MLNYNQNGPFREVQLGQLLGVVGGKGFSVV